MKIASLDLGHKNLALYIEECFPPVNSCILSTPLRRRKKIVESTNPVITEQMIFEGERIYLELFELTEKKNLPTITQAILNNLSDFLEERMEWFSSCDIVLIEKQFCSIKGINFKAIRLQHHIESWFLLKTNIKPIIWQSKFKTKAFILKNMTKYQRKKWTCQKSLDIFSQRNDQEGYQFLVEGGKIDDLSDAIMQVQSYKAKLMNLQPQKVPLKRQRKKSNLIDSYL